MIWKAVEPSPGVYDDAYINRIADTVRTLARHGIVSLLDFHQDLFNERFQGEGVPTGPSRTPGCRIPPSAFPPTTSPTPRSNTRSTSSGKRPGARWVGLQDRFAAAWAHVAARFAGDRNVLGYEVFNEPFPGSHWEGCVARMRMPRVRR